MKKERSPGPSTPLPEEGNADTEDAAGWGLTHQEGVVDLRNVLTWRDLYGPTSAMGLNTNPACTACPVAGCGAQATENPVIARGRLGMSARERTRVRILACFKNLRTCEAHV